MNPKPPIVAKIDVSDLGCTVEIRSSRNLSDFQIDALFKNWLTKRDKRRSFRGKTIEVIDRSVP